MEKNITTKALAGEKTIKKRGGYRPGSGRKKISDRSKVRKPYSFSISDTEAEQVKEYITALREASAKAEKEKQEEEEELAMFNRLYDGRCAETLPDGAIAKNTDSRYSISPLTKNPFGYDIRFPRDPRFNSVIKKFGAAWDTQRKIWNINANNAYKNMQQAFREYFGRDDQYIYEELIEVDIKVVGDISEEKNKYDKYNPMYLMGKFISDGGKNNGGNVVLGDDIIDNGDIDFIFDNKKMVLLAGSEIRLRDVRRSEFDKWQKHPQKGQNADFVATIVEENDDIEALKEEQERLTRRLRQIKELLKNKGYVTTNS